MQKYRIGEVSKILNISVDTIRFFEQKGIVSPEKDPESSYRYYTIWDINKMFDYKKYRELGFSLSESMEIIKNTNFQTFINRIDEKEKEIEEQIKYSKMKASKLENYKNVLKNAPKLVGQYPIVNRPEGYYYINRYYDADGIHLYYANMSEGCFEELMRHYTFVENIYRVKKEWFKGERKCDEYQWGFTIKKRWADSLEINILPQMEQIDAVPSIYTIIKAVDTEAFSPHLFKEAFAFMDKEEYQLSGDILGNLIAIVQEEGHRVRYMEVWIPIIKEK